MKCGMIPHFIFFAAAFAELTGTPCTQVPEENACCPPKKGDWSSTTLDSVVGLDVSIFCEVIIENTTLTNNTEVEWSVQSHRLKNDSFWKNVSFQHQVSDDGKKIKASLSLRNVTKNDSGLYIISFCNMCCSESCETALQVRDACSSKRPDPVQKEVTVNASLGVSTLKLAANFTGNTEQTQWLVIWSNSSTSGLGFLGGKYHTEHRVISHCFFTAELTIHNVSINDAGQYFAKVYDSMDTGVNTTFYVNIMNHGGQKKNKIVFVALVSILPAVGGVIAVIMCMWYCKFCQKQKRRHSESSSTDANGSLHLISPLISSGVEEEQEEVDYAFPTIHPQLAAQHCPYGPHTAFFLYCKTDVSEDSLHNMAHILAKYGISSCLDLHVSPETIPANWSVWTEEKIESCHYVILVCTAPLYKALKDNIKCTDKDLVEMFEGKFSSCAVVNCVRAPKFIPVFIDSTPDKNVVPTQLRTHHFFHLRVRELMQAVKGKPMEYVVKEIDNNPLFRDIKKLIDQLQ